MRTTRLKWHPLLPVFLAGTLFLYAAADFAYGDGALSRIATVNLAEAGEGRPVAGSGKTTFHKVIVIAGATDEAGIDETAMALNSAHGL